MSMQPAKGRLEIRRVQAKVSIKLAPLVWYFTAQPRERTGGSGTTWSLPLVKYRSIDGIGQL